MKFTLVSTTFFLMAAQALAAHTVISTKQEGPHALWYIPNSDEVAILGPTVDFGIHSFLRDLADQAISHTLATQSHTLSLLHTAVHTVGHVVKSVVGPEPVRVAWVALDESPHYTTVDSYGFTFPPPPPEPNLPERDLPEHNNGDSSESAGTTGWSWAWSLRGSPFEATGSPSCPSGSSSSGSSSSGSSSSGSSSSKSSSGSSSSSSKPSSEHSCDRPSTFPVPRSTRTRFVTRKTKQATTIPRRFKRRSLFVSVRDVLTAFGCLIYPDTRWNDLRRREEEEEDRRRHDRVRRNVQRREAARREAMLVRASQARNARIRRAKVAEYNLKHKPLIQPYQIRGGRKCA